MRFSRPYERSVLIYRETGAEGRILLRLGRTFEDGECKPDSVRAIPEGFDLLTYIIAKDPEALIDDIAQRFQEYLDPATETAFHNVVFNALHLQSRIQEEHDLSGGSDLIRGLDMLYGKQVMEILFEATFGRDGRKAQKNTRTSPSAGKARHSDLPMAKIGLGAFLAMVVIPIGIIAILRPETYRAIRTADTRSLIISYREHAEETLASETTPPAPRDDSHDDLFAEVRRKKLEFYLGAGFGNLNEDQEFERVIAPSGAPAQDETNGHAPAAATVSPDNPAGTGRLDAPENLPAAGPPQTPATPAVIEAAPASEPPIEDLVEADYGYEHDLAGFRIKELGTFDSSDTESQRMTLGTTAIYDIARKPGTIYDVLPKDFQGLPSAMDEAVGKICAYMAGHEASKKPLTSANLYLELGNSEFAATIVTPGACAAGHYRIFPLFDLPDPEEQ